LRILVEDIRSKAGQSKIDIPTGHSLIRTLRYGWSSPARTKNNLDP
jgi:hypothetical protein